MRGAGQFSGLPTFFEVGRGLGSRVVGPPREGRGVVLAYSHTHTLPLTHSPSRSHVRGAWGRTTGGPPTAADAGRSRWG